MIFLDKFECHYTQPSSMSAMTQIQMTMTEESEYQALREIFSGEIKGIVDGLVKKCRHSDRNMDGTCGSCAGLYKTYGVPPTPKPKFFSVNGIRIQRKTQSINVSPDNGPDLSISTGVSVTASFDAIGNPKDIKAWLEAFIDDYSSTGLGRRKPQTTNVHPSRKKEPVPEGLKGWLELGKYLKANEDLIRKQGGYTVPAHLSATGQAQFVEYIWPEGL